VALNAKIAAWDAASDLTPPSSSAFHISDSNREEQASRQDNNILPLLYYHSLNTVDWKHIPSTRHGGLGASLLHIARSLNCAVTELPCLPSLSHFVSNLSPPNFDMASRKKVLLKVRAPLPIALVRLIGTMGTNWSMAGYHLG
jgi:hypothetical protein